MTRLLATCLLLALAPLGALASVRVSEVAWMGSAESANDEWIELENTGASVVDLSGWVLEAEDGSPSIALSGSVAPAAFATLERTDDESVPGVSALLIYAGSLSNEGERLTLYDSSGTVVDTVDGRDGWDIGGDNETNDTLQRNGSGWVTAPATPGRAYAGGARTSGTEAGAAPTQRISDRPVIVTREHDEPIILKDEKERWSEVSFEIPEVVTEGTPFWMRARVRDEDGDERAAQVSWSTGDGGSYRGSDVRHRYRAPGQYVVFVSIERRHLDEVHRHEEKRSIEVVPATVAVSALGEGYVDVTNTGEHELDLSHWHAVGGGGIATLPAHTYVLPGASVRVAVETHEDVKTAALISPDKVVVATYPSTRVPDAVVRVAGEAPRPTAAAPTPTNDVVAATAPTQAQTALPSVEAEPTAQLASVAYASENMPPAAFNSSLWYWALLLVISVASAGLLMGPRPAREEVRTDEQGAALDAAETLPFAEEFTIIEENGKST